MMREVWEKSKPGWQTQWRVTSESEAAVSIIRAQWQTELCSAGKHSVWFVGALCGEVINQDSYVAFCSANDKRRLASDSKTCIDSSYDTLQEDWNV